ncbi:hypothetical protein OROGR_000233 [Orobanche gracilis]
MSWRRRVASSFLTPATAAAARGQDGGGLVPAVLGAVGSDSQPTRSGDEDAGYTRVRAAPIRMVKVESEIVTFAIKNLGSKGDRSSSGENSLLETTSTGQKRRC